MRKIIMRKQLKSEGLEISFKKFLSSSYNYINNISHNACQLFISFTKTTSQVTLEYFILFTIIALFTVIGLSTFFPKIQQSFSAMQVAAVDKIVNAGD